MQQIPCSILLEVVVNSAHHPVSLEPQVNIAIFSKIHVVLQYIWTWYSDKTMPSFLPDSVHHKGFHTNFPNSKV